MEYEEHEIVTGICCNCFKPIEHQDDEIFPLCKQCEYDRIMGQMMPVDRDYVEE